MNADADLSGDLRDGSQFSGEHVTNVVAFIVRLFNGSRPTAIPGLIVSVDIWISVERLSFGALPHVSQEVLE
ncbi:hypothetical protein [Burkholderia ubonensis]|uniref:hypothetical protein n=1 Tax=Burkholderia ubonensis TaxID=101571 RepID=UPI00075E7898|nr:hypothetical protein [Burkholderia ubonensis]KVC81377.1 hypothetical protein WI75_08480 [Burkholderia ubonensis]